VYYSCNDAEAMRSAQALAGDANAPACPLPWGSNSNFGMLAPRKAQNLGSGCKSMKAGVAPHGVTFQGDDLSGNQPFCTLVVQHEPA
jgi:hypothetical protein